MKKGADDAQEYQLATLSAGDTFGEMAILESSSRSATVRAKEDVTLAGICRETLAAFQKDEQSTWGRMVLNLARDLSSRLRHANEITVVAL